MDIRIFLLACIAVLFCLVTPFMVPNDGGRQWGARYFLPIIPITLVVLAVVARQWQFPAMGKWTMALTVSLFLITGYSFYRNTYKGGIRTLRRENSRRITPALNFINSHEGDVVVVSQHYIAMELGYLFDKRYFFLAPDDNSLQKLQSLLRANDVHGYTYIYDNRGGDFFYEHYPIP